MGVPNGHEISRILKEKYTPRQHTFPSVLHPKNNRGAKPSTPRFCHCLWEALPLRYGLDPVASQPEKQSTPRHSTMDLRHSCQCLHCNTVISLDDVNVASDLALCRGCGRTMKFSEIAPMAGAAEVDELHPPKGVRLEESVIHGQTIIYKKISPIVYFLIPFTAVWSGGRCSGSMARRLPRAGLICTRACLVCRFYSGRWY